MQCEAVVLDQETVVWLQADNARSALGDSVASPCPQFSPFNQIFMREQRA